MSFDSFDHERYQSASDVIMMNERLDDSRELGLRRQAALAEIDNAKFSWFHARVCIVAGIGFFTDAYDIFAINIAAIVLGYLYGDVPSGGVNDHDWAKTLPFQMELGLKIATPVGTMLGQFLFGWLADVKGRKKMYGIELMIMIVSTFAQAISANGPGGVLPIIPILIVWRLIMGIGIGGDYPLSAVMASEFASRKIRGRMMVAIFACQGWGFLVSSIVSFILTQIYEGDIDCSLPGPPGNVTSTINPCINFESYSNLSFSGLSFSNSTVPGRPEPFIDGGFNPTLDRIWRILIGLGCIPAVVALYFRLTVPETPRFTMDIDCNIQQATRDINNVVGDSSQSTLARTEEYGNSQAIERIHAPKSTWKDFRAYFKKKGNRKLLFATAYSWFALDVVYYGLIFNNPQLLKGLNIPFLNANPNQDRPRRNSLQVACTTNLIVAAAGLIPGYWVSFALIDSWGRRPIQLMGFMVLAVLFAVLAAAYGALKEKFATILFVVYCLANFFANFGPNVTSFVIPGELFPTRYRSTAHGFSAGMGKLGAIVGQIVVSSVNKTGVNVVGTEVIFGIFAGFMVTGALATWFLLPETKKRTLEDLSNEDQDNFVRGRLRRELLITRNAT